MSKNGLHRILMFLLKLNADLLVRGTKRIVKVDFHMHVDCDLS